MKPTLHLLLAALCLVTALPIAAAPADTAFTYQGQLKQSGTAATGSYDFQFSLYTKATGGGQIGKTLDVPAVAVAGGLFHTPLDFELNPFLEGARWLEIAVRPAGGGGYTTLSPRQELTATPYALKAKVAEQANYAAAAGSAPIPAGSITADKLAPGATGNTLNTGAPAVDAAANTSYTASGPAFQNFNLPLTATVGATIEVNGIGSGGWNATLFHPNLWTPRENNQNWRSVASSADGAKLVAGVDGGHLYTSPDSGVTWTARATNQRWVSIASSADGIKLVAAAFYGQLYTSGDSGVTWTPRENNRPWISVASSADGIKLVAAVNGGQLYTSVNSGVTWTDRASWRLWHSVASSASGAKLVAAVFDGQLYTSDDLGITWTARENSRPWISVASSADGTKLVAAAAGGQLWTSGDSGVNWTTTGSNRSWHSVASSADGTKLVAAAENSQLYTSVDSGAAWTAWESIRGWICVASSADGTKLVAAAAGGRLYTDNASGAAGYAEPRAEGSAGSRATLVFDGTNWVEVNANTFAGPVTITDANSDHDLRVTDGTNNGNWHLQTLRGGNSGYGMLGWNGYWDTNFPHRYNTTKALWRMHVDQRVGEDFWALDAYDGLTYRLVWRADAANGHMGIGKAPDAGFRLDVNGLIRTTGAVNTASDRRYKQDIQPLTSSLDKITRLKGVSYDWNREAFPDKHFPQGRQIGFIAQDVQEVLPELVTADSTGHLSVAYPAAVPVLVEAVKELRAENAELKARLERIEQLLAKPVAGTPVAGRSGTGTEIVPAPPAN